MKARNFQFPVNFYIYKIHLIEFLGLLNYIPGLGVEKCHGN